MQTRLTSAERASAPVFARNAGAVRTASCPASQRSDRGWPWASRGQSSTGGANKPLSKPRYQWQRPPEAAQKNMDEVMAAVVKLDAEIKLSMAGTHEAQMEALLVKAGKIVEAAVEKGDIIQAENGRIYAREHAPEQPTRKAERTRRRRARMTAAERRERPSHTASIAD